MARDEVYLRAKFHLDPSNRLARIHQLHRQSGQYMIGQIDNGLIDQGEPFYYWSPRMTTLIKQIRMLVLLCSSTYEGTQQSGDAEMCTQLF